MRENVHAPFSMTNYWHMLCLDTAEQLTHNLYYNSITLNPLLEEYIGELLQVEPM